MYHKIRSGRRNTENSGGLNQDWSTDRMNQTTTPQKGVRSSYKEWKQTRSIPKELNNTVSLANRKQTADIRNSFAESLNVDKMQQKVTVPAVERGYMAQTKSKMQRMS